MMVTTIGELRRAVPRHSLHHHEAQRLAEIQAALLLNAAGLIEPPVPEMLITTIRRLSVERAMNMPTSGLTIWDKGTWRIALNGQEALVRQRFSLAHEFKHVLDHPFISSMYMAYGGTSAEDRAEQIADYFAGCLLMPRPWIKALWDAGEHDPRQLAKRFEVSPAAMQVRLQQLGLPDPSYRCGRIRTKLRGIPNFI